MKYKFKINHLYLIIFIIFVCVLIGFGANTVKDIVFSQEEKKDTNAIETVDIDWEKQYPFKNSSVNEETPQQASKISIIKEIYEAILESVANYVGTNVERIPIYEELDNIGDNTKKYINKDLRFSQGTIQQIDNGQIINIEALTNGDREDVFINNCKDFKQFLDDKNTPLYYVQTLTKYDETGKYKSSINENRDYLIKGLTESNIKNIDLRIKAKVDNISVNDSFYKTDHHWKTSTGLWAAQHVINELDSSSGLFFDKNILDKTNYTLKTYPNAMLGSYGSVAGLNWTSPEDHTVYFPNFDTSFHIEIPNKSIDDVGSFQDVLFYNDKVDEFSNDQPGYIYETACYGNTPLTKITNLKNTNAPKVLVIRDSFALAVIPYLSCVCSEVDSIDIRKTNGNFNGSIRTYIDEFKPDIVLIILNDVFSYKLQ